MPDTPLISRAIEYAGEHSESYLFNHGMRSWLFPATQAQLNQTAHELTRDPVPFHLSFGLSACCVQTVNLIGILELRILNTISKFPVPY